MRIRVMSTNWRETRAAEGTDERWQSGGEGGSEQPQAKDRSLEIKEYFKGEGGLTLSALGDNGSCEDHLQGGKAMQAVASGGASRGR